MLSTVWAFLVCYCARNWLFSRHRYKAFLEPCRAFKSQNQLTHTNHGGGRSPPPHRYYLVFDFGSQRLLQGPQRAPQ